METTNNNAVVIANLHDTAIQSIEVNNIEVKESDLSDITVKFYQKDEKGMIEATLPISLPKSLEDESVGFVFGTMFQSMFDRVNHYKGQGLRLFKSNNPVYLHVSSANVVFDSANEINAVHPSFRFNSTPGSQSRFAKRTYSYFRLLFQRDKVVKLNDMLHNLDTDEKMRRSMFKNAKIS